MIIFTIQFWILKKAPEDAFLVCCSIFHFLIGWCSSFCAFLSVLLHHHHPPHTPSPLHICALDLITSEWKFSERLFGTRNRTHTHGISKAKRLKSSIFNSCLYISVSIAEALIAEQYAALFQQPWWNWMHIGYSSEIIYASVFFLQKSMCSNNNNTLGLHWGIYWVLYIECAVGCSSA